MDEIKPTSPEMELAERATESNIPWICIFCGTEWPVDSREELLKTHIRNDCEKHPWAQSRRLVRSALDIIELADNRSMAADGPVGHVRDNMSDDEWRKLYVSLKKAYNL